MDKFVQSENKHHFQLYKRYPITLVEGKGSIVKDSNGKEYIDALAGIAVNSLGHCHPAVVKAIAEQAKKLIHVSNLYYNPPQSELSELITEVSGMDRVFFCNSGAEAVEGAIKLARKIGNTRGKKGTIISAENCFHGRTIATIALGKEKYQKGFEPMPEGFSTIPFNDIEALRKEINSDTIALILEPVQGEGGIHVHTKEYLQEARKLCDENNVLLIFDEIQCGIGRTGKMFAYQHFGVKPDIITSAKALGSGFPIGAVLAKEEVASNFLPGEHGTTYGGNPLACATALATIKTILDEGLMDKALETGNKVFEKVRAEASRNNKIKEIRGLGLMIGVELSFKGAGVVGRMMEKGVLANVTMENTIRLVPPLNITENEMNRVLDVLFESINEEGNNE